MSVSADVQGGDALVASLGAALDQLHDLEVRAAADLLADKGEANAPRKTGTLAGTVEAVITSTGLALTAGGSTAPYAVKVHARNPWLITTTEDNKATVVGIVRDEVADTIHAIQGV